MLCLGAVGGADTREAKKRTQEFRTKYRYEQSPESKALAEAKCAVIEVRHLHLPPPLDAAILVCPAVLCSLQSSLCALTRMQVLEIILQFKTNSLLTVRFNAKPAASTLLAPSCLMSILYSVPLCILKYKCHECALLARARRRSSRSSSTASRWSRRRARSAACACRSCRPQWSPRSTHTTRGRAFTSRFSIFSSRRSLFSSTRVHGACRKGLDLQQRMGREIKRTTEQALGLPMDKLKEILIVQHTRLIIIISSSHSHIL